MKIHQCDSCGARIKEKQPAACPLCGEHEFSPHEEQPAVTDKKERDFIEKALHELDEYEEGCEPYDKHHYNTGE